MHKPARRATIIAAGAALAACGTIGVAAAAPSAPATTARTASTVSAARTARYFAFDINNGGADPGFVAVPGSNPKVFAQGDELIINDQVTITHRVGDGFPIIGHDSGVCTLTRIPEKFARQTLGNCVVTVVLKHGSLTVQGVVRFKSQQPQSAVLAVTGGTGDFAGAAGTVGVSFTKSHKILTFALK
jgi:hypothetical protein